MTISPELRALYSPPFVYDKVALDVVDTNGFALLDVIGKVVGSKHKNLTTTQRGELGSTVAALLTDAWREGEPNLHYYVVCKDGSLTDVNLSMDAKERLESIGHKLFTTVKERNAWQENNNGNSER